MPSNGRSPRGERGLKFVPSLAPPAPAPSLPSRGAWIEICCQKYKVFINFVAPLAGSVD